jgi:hypothetical protein
MTFEEINRVEERLGIKLPDAYRVYQFNYPNELTQLGFNREYLTDDPEYLLEMNDMLRKGGLPTEYLAIGNDVGGNYFFIKTDNADSSVYYFDHEEVSEREDGAESNWEEVLTLKCNNLGEFGEWLIDQWGGTEL